MCTFIFFEFPNRILSVHGMITRSMKLNSSFSVTHDQVAKAFRAIDSVGSELGFVEYRIVKTQPDTVVDFFHTFTSPKARGQGVGAAVVGAGLTWARDKNYKVIPSCSYVAAFMEKNVQFTSLL